jgi:hypothetical protein
MDYPKLRYVEAFPVEIQKQKLICLRDPQNLSGKMLFVSSEALFIISLLMEDTLYLIFRKNL